MAQIVKILPHTHAGLSLSPRTQRKTPSKVVCVCYPSAKELEKGRSHGSLTSKPILLGKLETS